MFIINQFVVKYSDIYEEDDFANQARKVLIVRLCFYNTLSLLSFLKCLYFFISLQDENNLISGIQASKLFLVLFQIYKKTR